MHSKILAIAISLGMFVPTAFASERDHQIIQQQNMFAVQGYVIYQAILDAKETQCASMQNETGCKSTIECKWNETACSEGETGCSADLAAISRSLSRTALIQMGCLWTVFAGFLAYASWR